jgi:predicted ATPase
VLHSSALVLQNNSKFMQKKKHKMDNNHIKFSIDNFRVFDKKHQFEFAPITLLTGPNNSGKSSLVKSLLMLKSEGSKNEIPVELTFPKNKISLSNGFDVFNDIKKPFNINFDTKILKNDLTISLDYYSDLGTSLVNYSLFNSNKCVLNSNMRDYNIKFDFNFWINLIKEAYINDLILEDLIYSKNFKNEFEESKRIFTQKNKDLLFFDISFEDEYLGSVSESIRKDFMEIQKHFYSDFKGIENYSSLDKEFKDWVFKLKIAYGLNNVYSNFKTNLDFKLLVIVMYLKYELQKKIDEKLVGNFVVSETSLLTFFRSKFSKQMNEAIVNGLNQLTDIEIFPVSKAYASRYFQESDMSDSFLSKAAIDFFKAESNFSAGDKNWSFLLWINKWLEKFGIGKSLLIKRLDSSDVVTIEIVDLNGKVRNLKDLGFGVSQVVSTLLTPYQINFEVDILHADNYGELKIEPHTYEKKPVFYLEEPESNLHPNWQSLLIELIADIYKIFGIRFIIETHSEYMIRKMQNMVAKDNSEKDTFKIYYFRGNDEYFNDESSNKKRCYEIRIDENGLLNRGFGPGFMDESGRLTLELLGNNPLYKN